MALAARVSASPADSSVAAPALSDSIALPASASPLSRVPGTLHTDAAALERALVRAGFENVRVALAGETLAVAFENRRWRQSAEALGQITRLAGRPPLAFERRFGLTAAAVSIDETDTQAPFRVRYPSDRDFPAPPLGTALSPTWRTLDFEVGPDLSYEIGHIYSPFQLRAEIEPSIAYNPWPGARATLGLIIPIRNDFETSDLNPDVNRVRPGALKLDQFAWLPGVALVSGSGGYLGDARYGVSLGAARPIAGGRLLFDAQWDETGFMSFTGAGMQYSSPDRWSGFAGVTWRPSFFNLAARLRAQRFLYGDQGGEFELRRTMGDFELAYFVVRSAGGNVYGVRLDLPVPPMLRPTGSRVRALPVSRFGMDFRDTSEPFGTALGGVASREGFLRQLSDPALAENGDRFRAGKGELNPARRDPEINWVSISGMTGFVNTPWAGVLGDREIEAGFNNVPRKWAFDHRGTNPNQIYYATLGFLPHLETAMRWTRIPGYKSFQEIVPDSRLTDMDRMVSARLELLAPRERRPGLAVGVEDAEGTRRFHSSYVVAGLPVTILQVQSRATLGYGLRVFEAARYVLDGAFGAIEISPWRPVAAQLEYDSEKWNAALAVAPGLGFRLRAALLHLESLSIGAGWYHPL